VDLSYYIWVARRAEEVFLIDTGFTPEAAAASGGREYYIRPSEALSFFNINPATLENVIITHLHYDHAGTIADFTEAEFHLQEREAAYATGKGMCHPWLRKPFQVEDIVAYVRKLYDGKIRFHSGDAELTPGLSVHRVGGHTDGMQVVRVYTKRGWVVVASDASHYYDNMMMKSPFPVVYHMGDKLDGYDKIFELASSPGHVIPGHDPLVAERYPMIGSNQGIVIVALDESPRIAVVDEA
jgi:glyoxylase-like metal-dependent hydrolase (beta-lactamase superfamily II)